MKSYDAGALAAYLRMISDGTAFTNWGETPDSRLRNKIVHSILTGKGIDFSSINELQKLKKYVKNIKPERKALEKAIEEFMIKEEDFKV